MHPDLRSSEPIRINGIYCTTYTGMYKEPECRLRQESSPNKQHLIENCRWLNKLIKNSTL